MRAQLALEHTVAAHCSTHQNTLQYTSIQLGIAGAKRQGLCVCNTHCNAHCNTHCNTLQHTLQHTLQLTLQHNTRRIVCESYLHVCACWFVCVCAYTPAMTQTEWHRAARWYTRHACTHWPPSSNISIFVCIRIPKISFSCAKMWIFLQKEPYMSIQRCACIFMEAALHLSAFSSHFLMQR